MTRRVLLFAFAFLFAASFTGAQTVIDPATVAVTFNSADHPSPDLASYQAILLDAAADAASGSPLQTGVLVPKAAAAVLSTTPPDYKLTFAQLGLSVPPCGLKQATCPQFTVVLLAIDTNNRVTARGVLSESAPFSAGSTAVQVAAPANIRVK